ncbi:hypothetical protein LCGC14_1855080 [marine sediment metagenome]|uniref:Uncharacterized protein n=1 Tax=marine sediment metagenome TaxID=412755 RepID=A0A0F9G948_9ZZZZ
MIDIVMDTMLREMPESQRYRWGKGVNYNGQLIIKGYTREQWNEWVKDNPRKETV